MTAFIDYLIAHPVAMFLFGVVLGTAYGVCLVVFAPKKKVPETKVDEDIIAAATPIPPPPAVPNPKFEQDVRDALSKEECSLVALRLVTSAVPKVHEMDKLTRLDLARLAVQLEEAGTKLKTENPSAVHEDIDQWVRHYVSSTTKLPELPQDEKIKLAMAKINRLRFVEATT
jgi:hypothetical protein